MKMYSLLPKKNTELLDYETAYKTWDLVASGTLGAAAASIDIQNIPSTYRYLHFYIQAKTTEVPTNPDLTIRFNNDAGVNRHTFELLWAVGAVITSVSLSGDIILWTSGDDTQQAIGSGFITNVAGQRKSCVVFGGYPGRTNICVGNYTDTGAEAAINRITAWWGAGNITAGSTYILMGLR